MNEYLIQPAIVASLAFLAAAFAHLRGYHERVVPLLFIAGVYLYATLFPDWDQDVRQFFVRSSLALFLFIAVLYDILRYIIIKTKGR